MKHLYLLLALFLIGPAANAQISPHQVDSLAGVIHGAKLGPRLRRQIDSLEALGRPKPRNHKVLYSWSTDGLVNLGNVNRFLFNQRASLRYVGGKIFWFELIPGFAYGKTNSQLAEREWTGNLNMTILYNKPVYGLLFAIGERSNLRRIDHRWLAGAGIGYHTGYGPNNGQRFKCSISTALISEVTNFVQSEDLRVIRSSTRLVMEYNFFRKRLLFYHSTFFQPAIDQANLRWSNGLDIRAPINKILVLQLSVLSTYESVTAMGRSNYDHRITFGLQLTNTR